MADTLVKICGMTRADDVEAACEAGADAVGFIVVPSSPRGVEFSRARQLAALAPEGVRTVVVYADTAVHLHSWDQFDLVQVYGRDGAPQPAHDRRPARAAGGAAAGGSAAAARPAARLRPGRGRAAGALAAGRGRARAGDPGRRLTPDNVAEAVRTARPWAVDTARGVESAPGVKDHDRMARFIRNAKEAA